MTKTDAASQTLSDINPDVVLEVSVFKKLLSCFAHAKALFFLAPFHSCVWVGAGGCHCSQI